MRGSGSGAVHEDRSDTNLVQESLGKRRSGAMVGSCRRDLLDHVIALNERHLKRLLAEYVNYYHEDRTHLGHSKRTLLRRAHVLRCLLYIDSLRVFSKIGAIGNVPRSLAIHLLPKR